MATRHARSDKTTNDKHTRILKALLQKPGNKYCVDCRKKDPRWASFNLGCFMCIRCSGVHRSMGTHISKVKSVDLDSWTQEQVEVMIKWGNEKANLYWEERLPASNIPNESTSGIDPWIRSKYERRQFAGRGALPDPSELGPIDEALLMDLHGKAEPVSSRPRAHMNTSAASSDSFTGVFAPPPANPTRSTFPKRTSQTAPSKVQGADLFSIGQPSATPAKANTDFFSFDDEPQAAAAPPTASKSPQAAPAAAPQPTTASQDLFAMVSPQGGAAGGAASPTAAAAAGNNDWKKNILSLYGNQPAGQRAPQQQPQQQQQQQSSQAFGQLQGMQSFGGFAQPSKPAAAPASSSSVWGDDDAFGAFSSAPAVSNTSTTNNNNNFFGATPAATNKTNGFGGMPQGGEFFNALAGTPSTGRSAAASPPPKNNDAFGDLLW